MRAGPQRNRRSRRRMLQLRSAEDAAWSNWSCWVLLDLLEFVIFWGNARARGVVRPVAVWLVRPVAVWLVCARLAGLWPFGRPALWPFGWSAFLRAYFGEPRATLAETTHGPGNRLQLHEALTRNCSSGLLRQTKQLRPRCC